jgi:hypothetical protein
MFRRRTTNQAPTEQQPRYATGVAAVPPTPELWETRQYAHDPRHAGRAALGETVQLAGETGATPAVPERARRQFNIDDMVAGPTEQHKMGGLVEDASGRMRERYPGVGFDLKAGRPPRIPREVMKDQLGLDVALAATVVLDPDDNKGQSPRVHILDRGPEWGKATEKEYRAPHLSAFAGPGGEMSDTSNNGGRYVAATDTFLDTMRQIRTGALQAEQPREGNGWVLLRERGQGVVIGRKTWQTTFNEQLPTTDPGTISGEHAALTPAGSDQLRIDDMSSNATAVLVAPEQQRQPSGESFWSQPH